ncbi:hypothetical protein TNCT_119451 [Trichonephila clavata]|uniref:Uncharacterized protein n=1 Tax=Trichonephila clavata TaxID=2740835 RepID=A0A8X6HYZ3_TRICU|nr:hypothetical protein TNCT_119451 [Trichonephila clavata]
MFIITENKPLKNFSPTTMGKSNYSTASPFEKTPFGFREAFEDPTWFCAGCTGTKEHLGLDFIPEPLVSSLDPTVDKGFRIRTKLT